MAWKVNHCICIKKPTGKYPDGFNILGTTNTASGLFAKNWSGREDSNLRPPEPHSGALPDCATSRPQFKLNKTGSIMDEYSPVCQSLSRLIYFFSSIFCSAFRSLFNSPSMERARVLLPEVPGFGLLFFPCFFAASSFLAPGRV